ncbi:pyridoxamine 5'-phosphate oxidase family protein [Winogradskyella sp.]|nr:pyridoxamine 5'-phosphate oxidase family protein [Winogradskyella sp.]MDC0006949.1 pyridoxamine 5'-phosphate oxidase family protein [Winogradskyella sp.]
MIDQFLEEVKRELISGPSKKRHPFRYFVLATDSNGKPKQRTVVLRKVLPDLSLVFYTDSRTDKLKDLKLNNQFSALFYHPKKLMQIRIEGHAALITDKDQIATYWHTVQEASKKDYSKTLAPSTTINNPDVVDYTTENHYFCPVKLIPNNIEYLRLKRPNHLRIAFSKKNDDWSGTFLVP